MSEIEESVADLNEEYDILGELGRGGSAIVYHGRDRDLGREVAIKVVRPRYGTTDDDSLQRLAREARTVAGLQHPNIVTVYAVKRLEDGGLALVMQLVPGLTLKQTIVANGPMSPPAVERVIRDVASALAFAHEHGVVHRDVKPENIFLDAVSGRALLSDFGIAHSTEFDSRLTMTGTAIGTPAYMSPEQIDGKPTDPRSDVYSLGLVAWEMLTGQRPWEGETLYNVIYKQKHDQLQAIDALRPGVPLRLQYMVERMLQKRPGARWAGAAGLLAFMDASVLPSDWKQWQDAHKRRRARAQAAAAAPSAPAGFINAALATIRFRRGETPPVAPIADASTNAAADPTVDTAALPMSESSATSGVIVRNDDDVGTWDDDWDGDDAESAPSWVRNAPPERLRNRAAMLAGLGLVVAVALGMAYQFSLRQSDNVPAPSSTLSDVGSVQVPVTVPQPAPPADSLLSARNDSMRTWQIDSAARAVRDSMVAAEQSRQAATPITASSNGKLAPPAAAARSNAPPPMQGASGAASGGSGSTVPVGSGSASTSMTSSIPPSSSGALPGRSGAPATGESAVGTVRGTDDRGLVAAGGRHSCALDGGRVLCWGANESGELGDGEQESRPTPLAIDADMEFASLVAGNEHTCGLTRAGEAYCWGDNDNGQLGDATTTSRSTPVRVAGGHSFRMLRAGFYHTCGLTTSNMIACWGSNARGQIGDNTTANRSSPLLIDAPVRFVSVAAGRDHTCGVATDGTAYCWGDNAAGQLGDGGHLRHLTPEPVSGSLRFTSIAAGQRHTCAVTEGGDAYCWGSNNLGQLGTGDATERTAPTKVESVARFVSVTAGLVHSCARTRSGEAFCWGSNVYGQLGDGTNTNRTAPVRVAAGGFTSINAVGSHTCGASSDGGTACWGYNKDGQLGDGSRNHRSRPLRITLPGK